MSDPPPCPRHRRGIEAAFAEYGDAADALPWVTPGRAREAEAERAARVASLGRSLGWSCRGTKPHLGPLPPGCRICTEGGWSCLFVNGKCNCRCFYCPTAQNEIGVPTTNRFPFPRPGDYADYLRRFGFTGASISGGEPLLTFERTLRYIAAVRGAMGEGFPIWLYTNGTLLDRERVGALVVAGLSEIRFDIGAVGYDLGAVAMAAGRVPCVTVEIPAVPEDRERLCRLLPVMAAEGVGHLNLHQLRVTPHNLERMRARRYTFLHGEKVTVLESELCALAVMESAAERGVALPIHYCSYVYKDRYQGLSARLRWAPFIAKDDESITANGFIRSLSAAGDPSVVSMAAARLRERGADPARWRLSGRGDRLFFHGSLWPLVDGFGLAFQAAYHRAVSGPGLSYRSPFTEVTVNAGTRLYVERHPEGPPIRLAGGRRKGFVRSVLERCEGEACRSWEAGEDPEAGRILDLEYLRPGLQDVF